MMQIYIREEVLRLLKEEIGSDQFPGNFESNADLTEYLLPKVGNYIRICDLINTQQYIKTRRAG